MFGWEFPPFNSGGLGTACLGLTRALSRQKIDLLFVLPKRVNISADYLKFLFADVEKLTFAEIPTLLHPYITS
ncbi:MAG: glycogen/starch synthase, partial [bacterium]